MGSFFCPPLRMHHGGQKRLPTLRFISCPSLKNLIDKTAPLIQAGRFDNIVDLLSLVSDNISFIDEAALQKTTKVAEEIMALGSGRVEMQYGWPMHKQKRWKNHQDCSR